VEHRRLFVPLTRVAYEWFASGSKRWEVRRAKGAFAAEKLAPGRRVEIRLGYRSAESSLWGMVSEVELAGTLRELLLRIPAAEVVPDAVDAQAAASTVGHILGVDIDEAGSFVAFRVELDEAERLPTTIPLATEYKAMTLAGKKTSTVRRGRRNIAPGPALLTFGDGAHPAVITAVSHTTARALTAADAIQDGFGSRAALLHALHQHYSELSESDEVTKVEFRCLP
jgi:hypothetical protein